MCPVCGRQLAGPCWRVPILQPLHLAVMVPLQPRVPSIEYVEACDMACGHTLACWLELRWKWRNGHFHADYRAQDRLAWLWHLLTPEDPWTQT